jgi:hypothetical protein
METYTRQQLHDLVWSGPMRDVAKKLGLSDNGLRKHCLKAFVPLPPQGHWNKVHAGQNVKTIPLPLRPPAYQIRSASANGTTAWSKNASWRSSQWRRFSTSP